MKNYNNTRVLITVTGTSGLNIVPAWHGWTTYHCIGLECYLVTSHDYWINSPWHHEWPICTIGSRDYCHAPLGISSFSFAIQNVWEMTTVVDKIACRSSTACPPPIVLRLFITDTISSATICSQYVKILRMRQKHDKFSCHNSRTTARWTEKPAYTTYNSTASEDDVPRASLHSRTLTVHELKVLSRNHKPP